MSLSPSLLPEREAIASALSQVQRRLRLNRLLTEAALIGGLVLLALITWRTLRWLGDTAPATSALVILLSILLAVLLLGALVREALTHPIGRPRAAAVSDRRAGLHDALTTASWFMDHPQPSDWVEAQRARAAAIARSLQTHRLVPVRAPSLAIVALGSAAAILLALWIAPPLRTDPSEAPEPSIPSTASGAGMEQLRRIIATMSDTAAARKLEAALAVLERSGSSLDERRHAAAQAQEAIEQMKIEAASKREDLQQLSETLRGQPGLEAVAEALAAGDAKRAAEMLAQIERQQASSADGHAPVPADASTAEKSLAQTLQEATQSSGGAQSQAPSQQAMKEAIDRLNEIARELQAANYVNEAWQQVKGPQMTADRSSGLTAGRFAEQTQASSTPSPGTGETPMGGGTMFRSAAVAEGKARTEQEGGTRAGDAIGDAPTDPLLGAHAERLEAQLKRAGITGEDQEGKPEDQPWFYKESQEQKSVVSAHDVQPRARFASAEAGSKAGISIEHRQIVKDYFMKLHGGAR
jgi:hypothetical protein